MSTRHNLRGFTLIELIVTVVITSIVMAGVMLGVNLITQHSADTLVRKQALSLAESQLESIESQTFISYPSYTYVPVPSGYTVNVTITSPTVYSNIPSADAALISVAVLDPTGQTTTLTGYRMNY